MRNSSTKQITPEQATELAAQIIRSGDDESARALATLLNGLAGIEDGDEREAIAVQASQRAYMKTDAFGNSLLAFINA